MKALLIVDLQNDFCPKGALPAPHGDRIVSVTNKVMDKFDLILASKDWHPVNSIHFETWPAHCVRGTPGAEFHPDLDTDKLDMVFLKGTDNKDDGYSAFEATNENLAEYLRQKGINELYVAGLTTEYCVKQTVLDALRYGFKTFLIEDAIQGICKNKNDVPMAIAEMKKAGVLIANTNDILMDKIKPGSLQPGTKQAEQAIPNSPVCYANSREVRTEYRDEETAEDKNQRKDNVSNTHLKTKSMKDIKLKRIYDDPSDDDGYRILVDRLWPRGISKEEAKLDEWDKKIAPSSELRQWFDHKEERFKEFSKRYREELNSSSDEINRLRKVSETKAITLLYGAKDPRINHAIVLKNKLLE